MSSLMDFLIENESSISDVEEIVLSERLKNFKFKIRPATNKEFNKYKNECRKVKRKDIQFDDAKFNELLIINHCVEPDFRDSEAIKKANVVSPADLVNKILKAGEITDLANAITKLSGFDVEPEELVEEVKN